MHAIILSYMNRFVLLLLFVMPLSASALLNFGGWVKNIPGTIDSKMFLRALPAFPPAGVYTFWASQGGNCLNGMQEVDILSPTKGLKSPPIMLQFIGAYTYSAGPAKFIGQSVIGKYLPAMVCILNYVSWVYCGVSLCPVITPLPFFAAPLIIWNGSSVR